MAPHRRGDPDESNFRSDRGPRTMDTFTRWIVGTVGAAIIALLSVLAMRDRQSLDQSLIHLDGRIIVAESRLSRHDMDIVRIDTKQERILSDLTELRKALDENTDKLDRMLFALRKNGYGNGK